MDGSWMDRQTTDSYTLGSGVVSYGISDHLSNGTDLFYNYDPIGNVLMISNASGDTIASYCQEGFGNVIQTVDSADNNYHLTTKEIDSDTGLYYFYARWYDPEGGRFISRDKISNPNLYAFVLNNPLYFTDAEGLKVIIGGGNPISLPDSPQKTRLPRHTEPIPRYPHNHYINPPHCPFYRIYMGACCLCWEEMGYLSWEDCFLNNCYCPYHQKEPKSPKTQPNIDNGMGMPVRDPYGNFL
jgi:RHS repeat-associated protein